MAGLIEKPGFNPIQIDTALPTIRSIEKLQDEHPRTVISSFKASPRSDLDPLIAFHVMAVSRYQAIHNWPPGLPSREIETDQYC